MMKPGVGTYYRFKELFDKYSKEAGKEQYLIPYFIAAHPGTTRRGHARARAVAEAERLPRRPGAGVPAVADGDGDRDVPHAARIRCARSRATAKKCTIPKGLRCAGCTRRSCAITTPNNWPVLREALRRMGRADLIGNGKHQLIPAWQPAGTGGEGEGRRVKGGNRVTGAGRATSAGQTAKRGDAAARPAPFRTQHTGLPPAPVDKQSPARGERPSGARTSGKLR